MKPTVVALLAALCCIAATPAPKAVRSNPAPQASGSPTAAFGVWTVHMTNLRYNVRTGNFSTPNKVVIDRPGGDITASRASGNQKLKTMTLTGDVVVHDRQGAFASAGGATQAKETPSTLTSDTLQVDDLAKVYTATGHVHYVQGDTTSDSDRGSLNDATHVLTLDGNVHIKKGDQKVSSDHFTYNTVTGDINATGKDVIMTFPGGPGPTIATPRPLHNPFSHKKPAATPHP